MAERALVLVGGQNQQVSNTTDLCIGRSIVTLGTNQDLQITPNGTGNVVPSTNIAFPTGSDHEVLVSAPGAGAMGNKLTIRAATGYSVSGNWTGGALVLLGGGGGTGGNGSGGATTVRGGPAASGIGIAGALYLDSGSVGVGGIINIGTLYAVGITVGGATTTSLSLGGSTTSIYLGGAPTSALNIQGRIGPSWGTPDVGFYKEVSHRLFIDDSTTATVAGGSMSIQSGKGGAAGGSAAGVGGSFSVACGQGGDASFSQDAGNGGAVTLTAGKGGSDTGFGYRGGTGGTISLVAGDGVRNSVWNKGWGGAISLTCGKGADADGASAAGKSGGSFTALGGVGGKAQNTTNYAGAGGSATIKGGDGGAGDGDQYGSPGGSASVVGGTGGARTSVVYGGDGGGASIVGGRGAAGTPTGSSASGGMAIIWGGQPGTDNGGGCGAGGDVQINGGWATDYLGNTTSGVVNVGTKMYNDVFIGSVLTTTYFNNSVALSRKESSGSYTEVVGDSYIGITNTGSPQNVYLLPATQSAGGGYGRIIIIKDQSGGAGTNNITVLPDGTTPDTIDGAANYKITTDYGSVTLISDAIASWWVIAKS